MHLGSRERGAKEEMKHILAGWKWGRNLAIGRISAALPLPTARALLSKGQPHSAIDSLFLGPSISLVTPWCWVWDCGAPCENPPFPNNCFVWESWNSLISIHFTSSFPLRILLFSHHSAKGEVPIQLSSGAHDRGQSQSECHNPPRVPWLVQDVQMTQSNQWDWERDSFLPLET